MPLAGPHDVVGAEAHRRLHRLEEQVERGQLVVQDAERGEERRALSLHADGGLGAVGSVGEHGHLHLGRIGVRHDEVRDGEELGEAVVARLVLEAEPVAADVDIDDAAPEHAGAR